MNSLNICFAELHTPLFLGGANLGHKLDTVNKRGLKMCFNQEYNGIDVTWNHKTAIVPINNVASFQFGETPAVTEKVNTPALNRITAQVSTPTSHVFENGAGKTKQ